MIINISFEDKVALVTGAASGLGLATARAFAELAKAMLGGAVGFRFRLL
jgi:NAD(P)-dependent dehydrogenase (short-subunit alcohol dehydrogenase family)